ncbi:translation initiation factor IF-3 [Vibrio chagasii]|nr:translation initiation factor IF-3 [Vibrio chagasii]
MRKGKKKSNGFRLRVKFRPGTDIGDYQVKLRNLTGFLEDGNKVKVTIRFRGREMAHQDIGVDVLNRLKADTEEFAVVEDLSQRELKVAR